jgi:hypothetical protein
VGLELKQLAFAFPRIPFRGCQGPNEFLDYPRPARNIERQNVEVLANSRISYSKKIVKFILET